MEERLLLHITIGMCFSKPHKRYDSDDSGFDLTFDLRVVYACSDNALCVLGSNNALASFSADK